MKATFFDAHVQLLHTRGGYKSTNFGGTKLVSPSPNPQLRFISPGNLANLSSSQAHSNRRGQIGIGIGTTNSF